MKVDLYPVKLDFCCGIVCLCVVEKYTSVACKNRFVHVSLRYRERCRPPYGCFMAKVLAIK